MSNCHHFLAGTISLNTFLTLHILSLFVFGYIAISNFNKTIEYVLIGLILGGGLWNLLERVQYGCVQDYFNFLNLFHFNLPDLIIVAGLLTLLLRIGIKSTMPK